MNPFDAGRVPPTTECKCCGALATLVGVVDFSRCGVDVVSEVEATGKPLAPTSSVTRKAEPYVGWPVYYYRCGACDFTFTRAMDHWTDADFARHIYNEDYVRQDRDYPEARPEFYAQMMERWFGHCRQRIRILDWGSGSGLLQKKLELRGFDAVESYDPFSRAQAPQGVFDLIVCIEVFEHVTQPRILFASLASHLKADGAVVFSTLCCPKEVIDAGIANWWYCVPRNGHVSFYSPQSLRLLSSERAWNYVRLTDYVHIAHSAGVPDWLSAAPLGS